MRDQRKSKRQVHAALLEHYEYFLLGFTKGYFRVEIWQQKPRTDARVNVFWQGIEYQDVGFATLNYRDTWDAKIGEDMAIRKAIAAIAKQIVHGQEPTRIEVITSSALAVQGVEEETC